MKPYSALLLCALLALCGCGASDKTDVSGTVKLDGEPIPEGDISFVITGSGKSGNGKITNGKYSAQVPPGKAKVQINASKSMPLPPGEKGMDGKTEEVRQYIPDKYNAKTELTADITGPNPSLNFDLKSK
jgi:hypothetical protein